MYMHTCTCIFSDINLTKTLFTCYLDIHMYMQICRALSLFKVRTIVISISAEMYIIFSGLIGGLRKDINSETATADV